MDHLRNIKALPANGAITATTPSVLSSADAAQMEKMATQIQGNYASQEVTPEQAELWMESWSMIVKAHGFEVLRRALMRHMLSSKFLPTLADVKEHVDRIMAEKRAEKAANATRELMDTIERERREFAAIPDEERVTFEDIMAEVNHNIAVKREAEAKVKIAAGARIPTPAPRPYCGPCKEWGNKTPSELRAIADQREQQMKDFADKIV